MGRGTPGGTDSPRADRWTPLPSPPGWLALVVVLGAVLLSVAAAGRGVLPGDVAVSRAVHDLPGPVPGALAWVADFLGTLSVLTAVGVAVVLVLAVMGRLGAVAFLLAALVSRSANPELKRLIESPRPTPDLVRITERATAMGFPSGHTMGVTLLYGALLVLASALLPPGRIRRIAQAGAGGVLLVTGFGRIQTGAHWPSDVLGGYLWGAGIILLLLWLYGALRRSAVRKRGGLAAR